MTDVSQAQPATVTSDRVFDLVVIGGGINGCGIAADAAGRRLSVLLAEAGDLAQGTSSASSKLIHGGLRYLEHYEFRLVREALAEREVLLTKAPHIIWPLRFVLPQVPGLRPRWMIRAGLLLYDHLYRRRLIPASQSLDLRSDPAGRPLAPDLTRGFAYWDCWADDARLVVLNARLAADKGAEILTRHRVIEARPDNGLWLVRIGSGTSSRDVRTRALVNAAGPWAGQVGHSITAPGLEHRPHLRLVKGSHIVGPRIAGADSAYLLQNADGRVVFAIPYVNRFTLIGTTDIPFTGDPANVAIEPDEEDYLIALAGRFFKVPLRRQNIVSRYAGVRPLYDDMSDNPSAVTRDYKLDLAVGPSMPPLLTVLGGKLTTYRRLAEEALERLAPHLPVMGRPWTRHGALPGGDIPNGDFEAFVTGITARHPAFEPPFLRQLARRHGTNVIRILGSAQTLADLGRDFGGGLTEREIIYLRDTEWAREPDDVLWRRTKAALLMPSGADIEQREAIRDILAGPARSF
jgi:glycerol-3-phosphate dehydrogenase